VVAICAVVLAAGAQAQKVTAKKAAATRANELTLAGLRPGRDTLERAVKLNGRNGTKNGSDGAQTEWHDVCRDVSLTLDTDKQQRIQVIRTSLWNGSTADCSKMPPGPWKTGLGLRAGDPAVKALETYGEPDSRSPSTKDGQPLELWYYAFDWAGADVPQVMEVLCTREAGGKAGRVVEITLAAPSL
jgi:hypothetical protein